MADQNIVGGAQLDAFLKSLPAKIEQNIMRSALRAGANEFKEEIKAKIPVRRGKLLRSVRVTTSAKRGKVKASIKVGGKKAPHANLVEFGTRPHKIKPKKAKALALLGMVVSEIDHPGARPHPFMRPAFDAKDQAAITAVGMQIRKRLTLQGINSPAPEAT